MIKHLKNRALFNLIILAITAFSATELSAAPKKSCLTGTYNKKSYSKKAPYAGYGNPSEVNGLPKTKITSGHVKKTNKGYTYVNPYARSK